MSKEIQCLGCGFEVLSEGDIFECDQCGAEFCEGCMTEGNCPMCAEEEN